ncbi:404a8819-7d25-4783-af72-0b49daed1416 [Sclerotinia trifoliorum]|uniref:404a8819-7d25-4783-af72-0b49daed1416 n=1 Tax=Sclerotinia trifoliorum TaxID=28548 RepID=A0A8H2ZND5_9HELO|nr:404a8819-7d25-4783-af72-0b49daed1416 [Sclerotinia trifoliorum]
MAMLLRLPCLFSACALITAAPVKIHSQRDLEYVRSPLTQSIEGISSKRDTEYVRNP